MQNAAAERVGCLNTMNSMPSYLFRQALLGAALAVCGVQAGAQVTLNIDAASRGAKIGPLHYGIFYEEINNAGDGGLYAELIRNRSFEANGLEFWTPLDGAEAVAIGTGLMNDAHLAALELKISEAGEGISNTGYWGIKATEGDTYSFSFWVKSDTPYSGTASFSLATAGGEVAAQGAVAFRADGKWTKVSGEMTATVTASDCKFNLTFDKPGTLCLDMVSLFPPTFRGRPNGCRRDLAEMLEAMQPSFVRFPGGCYIEGYGTAENNNRFEWKKTIGPVEERPGHYNHNWGYPCTDGMGFHEFLQLTEDLGAEPLFVVNIGLGHFYAVDYTDIDAYIQEALDAIEYCNGDVTTEWGARRAAAGHPEPFNLRLLEIGNENYNYDPNDLRFDHYAERYKAFYDAIKSRYPEITLIGNVESWGTDTPSWRNPYPVEMVDEHYYRTPGWFELQYGKYDSYDRTGPKIYVGEYAVTEPAGEVGAGPLRAALGEAVYMLGMERNSDIVVMNSYAPIFYNEERGGGWLPDMIRFTHADAFGIPSYYVQQLMATNVGRQNVKFTEENNTASLGKQVGVSTWSTRAYFDNVKITSPDGTEIFTDDFAAGIANWTAGSTWGNNNETLYQKNLSLQGDMAILNTELPDSNVFECDARKISGSEGFLIVFNYADASNYCWWNIGGWNNSQHGLQYCKNGTKSDFDLRPGKIESGRDYHIKVEVNGPSVKCWLDGELVHNVTFPVGRSLYFSSTVNDDDNTMFVKVVNTSGNATPLTINMANASMLSADVTVLTSASDTDINTLDNPRNVAPAAGAMESVAPSTSVYQVPPYSFSIIRFALGDAVKPEVGRSDLSDAAREEALDALAPVADRLRWLHEAVQLPTVLPSGASVEWFMEPPSADIAPVSGLYSATLDILRANSSEEPRAAGTLSATVRMPDGAEGVLQFPVTLAPADAFTGYLLTGAPSGGSVEFALAGESTMGKRFERLGAGSGIVAQDAFIARDSRNSRYLMAGVSADGLSVVLMQSPDLFHWESAPATFDSNVTAVESPRVVVDNDGKTQVYFLLRTTEGVKLVRSTADTGFGTLSAPEAFGPEGIAPAGFDLWKSGYDGRWHLLAAVPSRAALVHYVADAIDGDWSESASMALEGGAAVSSPVLVRLIGRDTHGLYYRTSGVTAKVTDTDFAVSTPGEAFALGGVGNMSVGGVMPVTAAEQQMLELWGVYASELAKAKTAQAGGDASYDAAIAMAETLVDSNRTVESLTAALRQALDALAAAKSASLSTDAPEGFNDVTYLLANPDFNANNGNGWLGTVFTAANAGVAEHFDKNFDTYQILENMPAGTYRLEAQGFYRYGSREYSFAAHRDGYERLHPVLYIADMETPFVSLHSEDYTLSNVPNDVWSANTAFNTAGKYTGNSVEYILPERGALRVGIRKTVTMSTDWTCFDNFRLYFKAASSGVEGVTSDSDSQLPPVYYNLQGIRVAHPAPGIYIVRRGNSVAKEIVR